MCVDSCLPPVVPEGTPCDKAKKGQPVDSTVHVAAQRECTAEKTRVRKCVSLVTDLRGPLVRLACQGLEEPHRRVECLKALQSTSVGARAQKTVRRGHISDLRTFRCQHTVCAALCIQSGTEC